MLHILIIYMFFGKFGNVLFFFVSIMYLYLFISAKKDLHIQKSFSTFYKAKNINQYKYINHLNDPDTKIVFAIGPAGTGKTLLACNTAIHQLKTQIINKIIITRPTIAVEEENLGFLPGDIQNKMDPWTRPIFDIFTEYYSQNELNKMITDNIIEISPLAYMRGRTFKNSFIIADEMQNSSPNQMLMLMTRIGLGTKMVVTGDLEQSDKDIYNNGLIDFINKFKLYEPYYYNLKKTELIKNDNNTKSDITHYNMGIKLVKMGKSDIERNPIIITLLDIYNTSNIKNETTINKVISKEKNNTLESDDNKEKNINKNNDAALIPLKHYVKLKNQY